ncbi:expressed protein [Phakopsora pachyrhizi]|uniref:Expressed protein n=1 Tax=Phakopsora pachyrhizi TaxID=170000 RepID=A0AAV0BA33_PHAPC|nr:expressed protein [Phakopsora pachyrhizi]
MKMISWSTCALILISSGSSIATLATNESLPGTHDTPSIPVVNQSLVATNDALPANVTTVVALNSVPGDMSSGSCMCPPPPACGASAPPAPPAPAVPSSAPTPDISSPTIPATEAPPKEGIPSPPKEDMPPPPKEDIPPPPVSEALKLKEITATAGVVLASIYSLTV